MNGMQTQRKHSGFTLVEILVVLAIIGILAAIILPVLSTVRGKGRAAVCQSNLRQIGTGITLYTQDYERYPRGLDAADKYTPHIWAGVPGATEVMAQTPMLPDVLSSYVKEKNLWACPSDIGYDYDDITNQPIDARPTGFEKFGLSYSYRTELTLLNLSEERVPLPAETNLLQDANGSFHGSSVPFVSENKRYNMLYVDGHVKSVDMSGLRQAWDTQLK
jgi:general secretion pathway protein G